MKYSTIGLHSLFGIPRQSMAWGLLILLFLVSRFLLILWGYQSINVWEEKEQGYIAIEMLSGGLRAPFWNYQVDTYSGGTLLFGLAAVPFIYLFGLSMFSLKLMVLFFALLTFIVILSFMNYFFGSRTAVYAALLWIFAPPVLTYNSLLALGSHEFLLPVMAFLFAFCFYLSRTDPKIRILSLSLSGFFAGLAITFSYIALIALIACMAVLIIVGRFRFSAFEIMGLIVGFIVGGFSWITYNIAHGFVGIGFLLGSINYNFQGPEALLGVLRFFAKVLPSSLSFPALMGLKSPSFFNYIYFMILALLLLGDIGRRCALGSQSKLQWPLICFFRFYLILFPVFYVLSHYQIFVVDSFYPWFYRYFVHCFAFAVLYLSSILVRMRFRRIVLSLLLALGFFSQVSSVWGKPFGEAFDHLAFKSGLRRYIWRHPPLPLVTSTKDFERFIKDLKTENGANLRIDLLKIANNPEFWSIALPRELVDSILKIPDENIRRYFFRRWGICLGLDHPGRDYSAPETLDTFNSILQALPENYHQDFNFGFGRGFDTDEIAIMENFMDAAGLKDRNMFYMAYGNTFFRLMRNDDAAGEMRLKTNLIAHLESSKKVWVYRGIGTVIYRSFRFNKILERNLDFLSPIVPKDHWKDLYWGVGWYLARRHWDKPQRGIKKLDQFSLPEREWAYKGFQYFHSMGQNLKHKT